MGLLLSRRGSIAESLLGSTVQAFHDVALLSYDLTAEDFADSTAITTLTDQTGNGNDATQATAGSKPTAQTASGMKVARFDGGDWLRTASATATVSQPVTYVVLAKYDNPDTNQRILVHSDTNGMSLMTFSGEWTYYAGGSALAGTNVVDDAGWHVFVCVFNGSGTTPFHEDGGANLGVADDSGSGAFEGTFTVGASGSGTATWDGDINFVGVYDGDLRTANLTLLNDLGQALADRAGITWTDIAAIGEPAITTLSGISHTAFDPVAEGLTDNTLVASMTDQSGNGRHATQATSTLQPKAVTVSGTKALEFGLQTGRTERLATANFTVTYGPWTVISLQKMKTLTDDSYPWGTDWVSGASPVSGYYASSQWRMYTGSGANSSHGTGNTNWHVMVTEFVNGASKLYIDGVKAGGTNTAALGAIDKLFLGNRDTLTADWDGYIGYFALYNGNLRTANLTALNNAGSALAARVGASWTNIT